MYKAGERLKCTVQAKVPDGYSVTILPDGVPAILRTELAHQVGDSFEAFFVCMFDGRVVVKQVNPVSFENIERSLRQQSSEVERALSASSDSRLSARLVAMLVTCHSIDCSLANSLASPEVMDDFQAVDEIMARLSQSNAMSEREFQAISKGVKLIREGTINFEKFAVAYYDEVTSGVPLLESLAVRGWLEN